MTVPTDQVLLEAVAALAAALRNLRAPGMIIGGMAVIARGVPRLTVDVDATVWGADVELMELFGTLAEQGIVPRVRDALEFDRHDVVTAEGGQAGLDEFAGALDAGKRFDIVITDLGMPYVDGRKVATRVRQLDPQVPIIMLTGWGHRLIATDDRPEHVDRVLSKPPKMAELRTTMAELLKSKSGH